MLGFIPKTGFIIGDGKNKCDWTYVDNVVHGHMLAAQKMVTGSNVGGQAFFITNDDPIPFWDLPIWIWTQLGYSTPKIHIPYVIAYYLALLIALLCWIISPIKKVSPTFSPFRVCISGSNRVFSVEKAKKNSWDINQLYHFKKGSK